jgi:hypothetical protein
VATLWTLGCDAADPDRIVAFWAQALGYIAELVATRTSIIGLGVGLYADYGSAQRMYAKRDRPSRVENMTAARGDQVPEERRVRS